MRLLQPLEQRPGCRLGFREPPGSQHPAVRGDPHEESEVATPYELADHPSSKSSRAQLVSIPFVSSSRYRPRHGQAHTFRPTIRKIPAVAQVAVLPTFTPSLSIC